MKQVTLQSVFESFEAAENNERANLVASMNKWLKAIGMLHARIDEQYKEMCADYGRAVRSAKNWLNGEKGELSLPLTLLWLRSIRDKQAALKQDTALIDNVLKLLN